MVKWAAVLVTALSVGACDEGEEVYPEGDRTVLLYLAGDNDLNRYALENIRSLREGMKGVSGRIVIYFDSRYSAPCLMTIKGENNPVIDTLEFYEEEDSADPATLRRVIAETKRRYPSESYGLILWSHGTGWFPEHYSFPEEINMPQGTSVVTLPIDFDLTGINMVRNWVLPLTIVDRPGVYLGHPRKNYAKALLNIKPFNDYSGTYSTTTLQSFIANADGSYDQANPIVRNTRTGQVVDENTIFFYAGAMEEDLINREDYKVNFYFNPETEMVELSSDNESLKLEQLNKDQSVYTIAEVPDQERPYLIHRYVIFNIEYTFVDYTSVKGTEIAYHVKGTMSLERKINTQIPDEDQAIEW